MRTQHSLRITALHPPSPAPASPGWELVTWCPASRGDAQVAEWPQAFPLTASPASSCPATSSTQPPVGFLLLTLTWHVVGSFPTSLENHLLPPSKFLLIRPDAGSPAHSRPAFPSPSPVPVAHPSQCCTITLRMSQPVETDAGLRPAQPPAPPPAPSTHQKRTVLLHQLMAGTAIVSGQRGPGALDLPDPAPH